RRSGPPGRRPRRRSRRGGPEGLRGSSAPSVSPSSRPFAITLARLGPELDFIPARRQSDDRKSLRGDVGPVLAYLGLRGCAAALRRTTRTIRGGVSVNRASPASLGRRWFSAIVAVSALFVLLTFLGFLVQGFGGPARPLFWLGLSGENNVGAWWSGMLLLLAAMLAFDGFASPTKRETERRGWLALSMLLLFLSFDELASLHEHLAARSLGQIAALALPLVVLGCYALIQLHRGGLARRHVGLLLVAYVLLGSVPLQEYVQHSREWPSGAIYGLRAAIEEG